MIKYMVRFWEYNENIARYEVNGDVIPRIGEIIRVDAHRGLVTGIIHVNKGNSFTMTQIVDVELYYDDN